MSLYKIGIISLGCYRDPKRYLEDVDFLFNSYIEESSMGDYPTVRLIGSDSYGMNFSGELGLVSDVSSRDRVELDGLNKITFDKYVTSILSEVYPRRKNKEDFLGIYDRDTSMLFKSPMWEGLDITLVYGYMYKYVPLDSDFDLMIIIDNPPRNVSNTGSIIKKLIEKCTDESYLYTSKSKDSLRFLDEFEHVSVDKL